jgi:hypothetical protein
MQYSIMHCVPCCGPGSPPPPEEEYKYPMSMNETTTAASDNVLVEGTTDTAALLRNEIADASYERLRKAIGEKVTAALTSGKILITQRPTEIQTDKDSSVASFGPIDYHHWHLALPQEAQQTYRCNHCAQAWSIMTSLAVLNEDGSVTRPLAEAILECSDDSVVTAMFEQHPDVKANLENLATYRAQFLPLAGLPSHLLFEGEDVDGYEHFFGATKDVVKAFNAQLEQFGDLNYIQTVYTKLTSQRLHPELLAKIFKYVEIKLPNVREDTALTRAPALVELIKTIRTMESNGGRGFLYLWSMLIKKENGWLRHLYKSVLGIVLDATVEMNDVDNMEMALLRVKELMGKATADENYKNKSAPASDQGLDGAVKFLSDNGFTTSLNRRLLPLEEVTSVFWTMQDPKAETPVVVEKPLSKLEQARASLKNQRDPAATGAAKLDEILGKHVEQVDMSVAAFIENISNYASLAVSYRVTGMIPVFVTGPEEEGDHDQLLNFDKGVHPHAHLLAMSQPMTYQQLAQMAEVEPGVLPLPKELPVLAMFRSKRFDDGDTNYVLHLENLGFNFWKMMEKHGSCILGTTIRSEHFGHSRALVDLSRNIPMDTTAGRSTAGGVFLRVGTVFNAVRMDGTREEITLTSVK